MISVIIATYNYPYIDRLKAAVNSLSWGDIKNDIEIIISTNDKAYLHYTWNKNVRILILKANNFECNLGFYRNIAVKISKGEYLYFTDADIIIYKSDYLSVLEDIAERENKSVLIQPKMFRLTENIDQFCKDFNTKKK